LIKNIPFIIVLLLILSGCISTAGREMYEYSDMGKDDVTPLESGVELPRIELFVSAPFAEIKIADVLEDEEIRIPEEVVLLHEQIEENQPSTGEEVAGEPVVSQDAESFETDKNITAIVHQPEYSAVTREEKDESEGIQEKDEPEGIQEIDEPEGIQEIDEPEEIREKVEPDSVPEKTTILKTIETDIGEDLIIELDREGWIFNSGPSSVVLKKREFIDDGTRFLFTINDGGEFLLTFHLQNLTTGDSEEAEYAITAEFSEKNGNSPIVIEPALDDEADIVDSEIQEDILAAVEEENIPELVASFSHLISEDEPLDSRTLSEAFDLLERQGGYDQYLVGLAEKVFRLYPYDNLSAELLYKAALTVEKPGPEQNIEKALKLFKLVRDYFPISIYCDKSEERIRYLERHFMKIY